MDNLIARLEKATGPDREMDWLILNKLQPFASKFKQWPGLAWISAEKGMVIPLYTSSMDAALTLYENCPDRIPSNPRLACVEALKARAIE